MHKRLLLTGIWFAILFNSPSDVFAAACTSEDLSTSRIFRGIPVKVVADSPVLVYSEPSTSAEVIAKMDVHRQISIASEAECSEEGIWWPILWRENNQTRVNRGYVLESSDCEPQIVSSIQDLNIPDESPVITSDNVEQLHVIATAEYEWPLQVVWSPNGEHLAISTPWAVWVHHLTEAETDPIQITPTVFAAIGRHGSVAFSPDSNTIAVISTSGSLHLVSLIDQMEQIIHVDDPDYAGIAAISHDLDKWVTANFDGEIALWDVQTGQQIHSLEGHTKVGGLAFTPDGAILVSNGAGSYSGLEQVDPTVRLWNVETGEQLTMLTVNSLQSMNFRPVSDIFISADGETAGILDFREVDNEELAWFIQLIDIPNRSSATRIPVSGDDGPRSLAFSATGNILAINFSTSIVLLDPESGTQLFVIPFDHIVQSSAFSPDGTLLAIGREDLISGVEIWAIP
jgi:WD40 repeat protein